MYRWVLLVSTVLFCVTHRHALTMRGFADDLTVLEYVTGAKAAGAIGEHLLTKVVGPLWGPGGTMWRPWAYASFALDLELFGRSTGYWHVTNLALHFASASIVGLWSYAWTAQRIAATAAFATMLLYPGASEITLWLVGRFDAWATCAVLASLYGSLRCRGLDRWFALSIVCGTIAYASKESATILFPAALGVALVRFLGPSLRPGTTIPAPPDLQRASCLRTSLLIGLTHAALLLAYAWIRYVTVGTYSTNVYGAPPPADVAELFDRIVAHLRVLAALANRAPFASSLAAITGLLACTAAVTSKSRWLALICAAGVLMVFAGAALHFKVGQVAGGGYRIYYAAMPALAVLIGLGFAALRSRYPRATMPALATLVLSLAIWQNAENKAWWETAKEIERTVQAIASEAQSLQPDDYGLLMLPGRNDGVYAFENAQGAIMMAATAAVPGINALDAMVAFMPTQLDEWHGLMQQDVVHKIAKRPRAPAQPTRFYCKQWGTTKLTYLGWWPPKDPLQWRNQWQRAVAAACPSLKL